MESKGCVRGVLGWWRSRIGGGGVVVTTSEIDAVCDRYGLEAHIIPHAEKTLVWDRKGVYLGAFTPHTDTMTPDEFESLVLPLVLEGAFCS